MSGAIVTVCLVVAALSNLNTPAGWIILAGLVWLFRQTPPP